MAEALEGVSAQICCELNKSLTERDYPALPPDLQATLRGQICSVTQEDNPVRSLVGEDAARLRSLSLRPLPVPLVQVYSWSCLSVSSPSPLIMLYCFFFFLHSTVCCSLIFILGHLTYLGLIHHALLFSVTLLFQYSTFINKWDKAIEWILLYKRAG